MKLSSLILAGAAISLFAASASADTIRGKIVRTQGHVAPNCRVVTVKRNDNQQLVHLRIAATGAEDGVLAVTLTALTTGLDVEVVFTTGVTTGCGTEPRIEWITLLAPGQ
jgi:hypothetical protein